jgi:oxygen-independent coproporphyrinogen-3 oxidase
VSGTLEANGYQWEEISNWAKPGHECRHNHVYWDQDDYVGFGSAAHSHRHGRRFWNVRTPDRYVAMVRDGTRPLGGEESLDARTQTFERDSLALRTAKGVPLEAFDSLDEIAHLVSVADGRVTLAPNGRLLANQVILRLGSAE